jgi:hypothetical protein
MAVLVDAVLAAGFTLPYSLSLFCQTVRFSYLLGLPFSGKGELIMVAGDNM